MSRPHFAQDPVDPLLTTREAALRLGVSLRTVQLWVEAGTLPAGRTPGGHRRIRLSAVEALAQRSGLRAAADPNAGGSGGNAPLDVLLVGASVDQLQAWQEALQSLGALIQLRGANNGYTGMLQLGRKVPDLLVTDLSMPDIDGYAMLLTLASLHEYGAMRVLAITAQTPQYIAERGGLPERVRVLHQPAPAQAVRSWVEGELVRAGRPISLGVVT
ncbi:MAG TPA: excisionase family DNA-binding protein [Burkholderiaceae bacterium]|nr:excisionase family DNA-binding protein [Burkholderiaceae bacterium]HMX09864.1 excisionase family DNA-binding protein [Burkholderiaceae bacterium]HMY99291.1 excisionase family DNA-binding protein [Burkholderiaceae bacterium]HNB44633.1 excisionase family DNA-binding protein [Burkholderiaceae bacterium]HNG66344.1 excisionase family DNA-binding protein [Thauera aminoaromatica]